MSRPHKKIDWEKVDQLLLAGCHGTEIAPHFDLHVNTFYDRVVEKYGISFTDYSTQKKQQGDSILRAKQFELALKKDRTMLIWLGKQRLGQRERIVEERITDEDRKQGEKILRQIAAAQKSYCESVDESSSDLSADNTNINE